MFLDDDTLVRRGLPFLAYPHDRVPLQRHSTGLGVPTWTVPSSDRTGCLEPNTGNPCAQDRSEDDDIDEQEQDEFGRERFVTVPVRDGRTVSVLASVLADGRLLPFGTAPPSMELPDSVRAHYDSVRSGEDDGPGVVSMVSEALTATSMISSGALGSGRAEINDSKQDGSSNTSETGGSRSQADSSQAGGGRERDEVDPSVHLGAPALWLFRCPTATRELCKTVIRQWWFDPLGLVMIFANCIFLAIEPPAGTQGADDITPRTRAVLDASDVLFTVFFTIEVSVRLAALGINMKDHRSFFRSTWNWLDLVVVVEGLVSLLNVLAGSVSLAPLRAIRALRPLRSIDRLPGLRQLVDSIVFSLPLLGNAFAVILLYFTVFAGVGMELWQGSLR